MDGWVGVGMAGLNDGLVLAFFFLGNGLRLCSGLWDGLQGMIHAIWVAILSYLGLGRLGFWGYM